MRRTADRLLAPLLALGALAAGTEALLLDGTWAAVLGLLALVCALWAGIEFEREHGNAPPSELDTWGRDG